MAQLTEKGLASLEKLRDYFPEATYPSGRPRFSSIKMRQKYLLLGIEKDPKFLIEQHSILREDWEKLKKQGLIVDTTTEPIYVVEGTDKVLYRGGEEFVKITRPSDSNFRSGQIVSKREFDKIVKAVGEQEGEIPLGQVLPETPEADWDRRTLDAN